MVGEVYPSQGEGGGLRGRPQVNWSDKVEENLNKRGMNTRQRKEL